MSKKKVELFSYLILIGYTLLSINAWAQTQTQSKLIAVGSEGIKITKEDVDAVKAYFEDKGFKSKKDDYPDATVKLRLFAVEAVNLGLAGKKEEIDINRLTIEQQIFLKEMYFDFIVESYDPGSEVIESYYWAHPDYFFDKENFDKEKFPEPDLLPLTDKLKESIRYRIAKARKNYLTDRASDDLYQKYQIKKCAEKGVECK